MSNQTEDQINLNEFEDLKPLKNQDLDTVSVDSSNIKVPKYYNFFALKLKEKYTFARKIYILFRSSESSYFEYGSN